MTEVTLLTAFIAGVFSISSPCVLPLVPIYLTHIAGVSAGPSASRGRGVVMRNAVAYVAGFSLVFVALGAALGTAGALSGSLDALEQNRVWLVRAGGLLLLILGFHQLGWVSLPFMQRTRQLGLEAGTPGSVASSFIIGITFGAGWSPCLGPILGAILTMAYGQASIERATLLLAIYSIGMGVPFLLAAAAFGNAQAFIRRINRRLGLITTISGAVMIGIGAIMLLGIYETLFTEITRIAPWTPFEPTL